jgi:large subunit ribosomal protein L17
MINSQKTNQLGRKRNARNALIKTLAVSLIRDGKIQTTLTKAKVIRPMVERLVTKAKTGTVAARRDILAVVGAVSAKTLVDTIALKYKDRNGGYLRIIKLNDRKGDGAKYAQIEFV